MSADHDTPPDEQQRKKSTLDSSFAAYLAIGIGVGTALGVSFDNVALGVGIGVAIGTALGLTVGASRSKKPDGDDRTPEA